MDFLNYYHGKFAEDANTKHGRNGWIIGRFMEGHRHTQAVSFKYWTFNKGDEKTHTPKYELHAVECNFILEGRVRGMIDGKEIILEKGDYVVTPAKIHSNLIEEVLEEPLVGFTVKSPSLPKEDSIKLPG